MCVDFVLRLNKSEIQDQTIPLLTEKKISYIDLSLKNATAD